MLEYVLRNPWWSASTRPVDPALRLDPETGSSLAVMEWTEDCRLQSIPSLQQTWKWSSSPVCRGTWSQSWAMPSTSMIVQKKRVMILSNTRESGGFAGVIYTPWKRTSGERTARRWHGDGTITGRFGSLAAARKKTIFFGQRHGELHESDALQSQTQLMGLLYMPTLGWCQGGQWGGIYSSPMECLGVEDPKPRDVSVSFRVLKTQRREGTVAPPTTTMLVWNGKSIRPRSRIFPCFYQRYGRTVF